MRSASRRPAPEASSHNPAQVSPREWSRNVESGLLQRCPDIEPDRVRDAVRETVISCIQFRSEKLSGAAKRRPPSLVDRQLPVRIRALKQTETTLASLLAKRRGEIVITDELRLALLADELHRASSPLEWIIAASLPDDFFESVAAPILRALASVRALIDDLGRARNLYAPISQGKENPRRNHVNRLMKIFAHLRGEDIAEVAIGDPESDYNPLLRYLKAANTPMISPIGEFPIFIPAGTLKADARAIRAAAQSQRR